MGRCFSLCGKLWSIGSPLWFNSWTNRTKLHMNDLSLHTHLKERLAQHEPRRINQPELKEAAVLLAITAEQQPRIVLTRRSETVSTHRGEVAFPGGKRDPEDESIVATALREAHEEIGLHSSQVQVIGELDQVVSRFGFLITPVLAVIPPSLDHVPHLAELDAIFEVPLEFFGQPPEEFFEKERFRIPTYDYEGFRIWGITAMIIAEMLNNIWECEIPVQI